MYRLIAACVTLIYLSTSHTLLATIDGDKSFDIPELGGIIIDGDAKDWESRGFRVEVMTDERGRYQVPNDYYAKLRLGWSDTGLLVLVTVRDDVIEETSNPRRMFEADSIELFIGTRRGVHDYYMVLIGPGLSPSHPDMRHVFFDERGGGAEAAPQQQELSVDLARRRTQDGYLIEALIPWANLGINAEAGSEVAFQAYVMDKDPEEKTTRVAFYPAFDTHLNNTTSMYRLLMSDKASSPVEAVVRGRHRDVEVVAVPEFASRQVRVVKKGEALAEQNLVVRDGKAAASLRLPAPDGRLPIGTFEVYLDGQLLETIRRGSSTAMLGTAVSEGMLGMSQYVFSGKRFPIAEFKHPGAVRELVGKYSISSRYFNSQYQEVENAEEPGRYGVAVEVQHEYGRSARRFFSLFRTTDAEAIPMRNAPVSLAAELEAIVMPNSDSLTQVVEAPSEDVTEQSAVRRSATFERGSSGGAEKDPEFCTLADKRWWVNFKRHFYDMDRLPPTLPMPEYLEVAATILQDGSPEEAGLSSQLPDDLDALCQDWLKAGRVGAFTMCVARHGVVVFHRAYGDIDGQPMTVDTPVPMTSMTKLLTGVVVMMYADNQLIELDAPLDRYIPALRGIEVIHPMTIRQLLTHTSGLRGQEGDQMKDLSERIADLYSSMKIPVVYIYSGKGYALTVKALELISNKPLVEIYRTLLLDPLECKHTSVPDSHGGAASTALDFAKIGQMLLNGGSYGNYHFLGNEAVDAMRPKQLSMILGDNTSQTWGIGPWKIDDSYDFTNGAFGHPSRNSSIIWIDPDNDLLLVIASKDEFKSLTDERRKLIVKTIRSSISGPR